VVVGLALLAAVLVGQGASSSSTQGPVVFHATITVTGEIRTKESYTDKRTASHLSSCAQAALHGDRPSMAPDTWLVPTPPLDNAVDIEVGTPARGYHGPGDYPQGVLAQGNGAMDAGPESYDVTSADATTSMYVNTDGSGSVTFTHAPGDDDSPHRGWHGAISGTIAWTCTT